MLESLTIKQLAPIATLACWLISRQGLRWPGILLAADLSLYAVVELYAKSLALRSENNLWLYNGYGPVEFLLKSSLAVACISHWKARRFACILMVVYGVVHFCERAGSKGMDELLVRSALTSAVLLALFFTYLLFCLAEDETQVLYQRPEFILFLGFTVYNGGMVPITGLLSMLNEHDVELSSRLFVINDVLYYISYTAIIVAAWCFRRSGKAVWRTKI